MSDKQGTGFGLSRYWADLTNLLTGGAGSFGEVVVPVGNVAPGATDSGNPVKVGGVYNSTLPTYTTGQRGDMQQDSRGNLRVALMSTDGTATPSIGAPADAISNANSGLRTVTYGLIFNGTSWDRDARATSTSRIVSAAATTNATSAKASAGVVHTIDCYNAAAAVKYLKLYNKASAPTVGTDTPVRTIALKPTDRTVIFFPKGLYFSTGIAYALTGAAADADTTALVAADVVGLNIDYN